MSLRYIDPTLFCSFTLRGRTLPKKKRKKEKKKKKKSQDIRALKVLGDPD
jgi:hypothetical protein